MATTHIIDRRLNGKHKSAVNRQRFMRRYRRHISEAISDAIQKRSITDMAHGKNVSIPARDILEPVFRHGAGGKRHVIHPGNREFVVGDQIAKPKGAGGGGGSEASDRGEGMDDFVFQISQEEFLQFLFEDLELPNLVRKQLMDTHSYHYVRAGFATKGSPSKINIVRSLRGAYARRLSLGGRLRRKIRELTATLEALEKEPATGELAFDREEQIKALRAEISRLQKRLKALPFIDEFDLRFNQYLPEAVPATSAVMFCIMDVSGSMNQERKDIAKRFFLLLYLFLHRTYERIHVVFIRHHTEASEVDEETFFYSRETGGTMVSSALKLMRSVIQDRYPPSDWNLYAAQASDGDNWPDDSPTCLKLLQEAILPLVQYYAYVEIAADKHQALWKHYENLQAPFKGRFAMSQIAHQSEIYGVFKDLFRRKVS